MEQSFVNTEAGADSLALKRNTRRERVQLKPVSDKRKLKPGLY